MYFFSCPVIVLPSCSFCFYLDLLGFFVVFVFVYAPTCPEFLHSFFKTQFVVSLTSYLGSSLLIFFGHISVTAHLLVIVAANSTECSLLGTVMLIISSQLGRFYFYPHFTNEKLTHFTQLVSQRDSFQVVWTSLSL